MARSPLFDNVDPRLVAAFEANPTGGRYTARATSGYRPGDPRYHGKGAAMDIELYDPTTGAALENYQDAGTAYFYQQYANKLYNWAQQNDPALAEQLRWGGYFSGGPGKYGALDLMHFDVGGGAGGTPMGGGSWGSGFTPEQMAIWGIKDAGGLGAGPPAAYADAWKRAFLATIASGESPGYDVMYGGQKFTDYASHPHAMQTANGITSDAAGRYQFLGSTWDEQAKKYGYKDFSPETQDTAAWNYASDIYKTKTGGSLQEALQSGDPARINAAAQVLNQTWTSLPGGKEASKGYGDKTFYDVYTGNMKNAPPVSSTPTPDPKTGIPVPTAKAEPKQSGFAKAMESLGGGLGDVGMGSTAAPLQTKQVAAAPSLQMPMQSTINPDMANAQREMLAQALVRLNSGRLYG